MWASSTLTSVECTLPLTNPTQPAVFAGPLSCGTNSHVLETVPNPQLMFFFLWLSFACSHSQTKLFFPGLITDFSPFACLPSCLPSMVSVSLEGLELTLWTSWQWTCGHLLAFAYQMVRLQVCTTKLTNTVISLSVFFEGLSLGKHEMAYASGNEPEMQRKYS